MTTLAELDEAQRAERFDRLQARMPAVWDAMKLDHEDESVVVVPSVSIDRQVVASGGAVQAFEERFLFLLLLLRQPRLRMIYVTSMPIAPSIIEYYLALLPGVIPSHARGRLTLVAVGDSTLRSLSQKLLERPRLLDAIAARIPNRHRCHLITYSTSARERDIALSLGIPVYGSDPRLTALGSKSGGRRLFEEQRVPHPAGARDLHSQDDVVDAILALLERRPEVTEVVVKLDEGVSGNGNARVDLHGLPGLRAADRRAQVAQRVATMTLESALMTRPTYWERFAGGGVVEERLDGTEVRSPSVQLRVRPDGSVELLSTHDQLLGGTGGQSYLGCTFPADPAYSRLISVPAEAVGRRLAREGVLGRFALDFLAVRQGDGWSVHAIELNLRKGGTTHPFLTLQFLTDGRYDGGSGRFLTASGQEKHLVATDHLEHPALRTLSISDLFDVLARRGLHFDHGTQTGVVFHMISSLTELGRVGMTAVGNTPVQARSMYDRAERALLDEAEVAGRDLVLPE
jgi:PGM1 C-terminal domain